MLEENHIIKLLEDIVELDDLLTDLSLICGEDKNENRSLNTKMHKIKTRLSIENKISELSLYFKNIPELEKIFILLRNTYIENFISSEGEE